MNNKVIFCLKINFLNNTLVHYSFFTNLSINLIFYLSIYLCLFISIYGYIYCSQSVSIYLSIYLSHLLFSYFYTFFPSLTVILLFFSYDLFVLFFCWFCFVLPSLLSSEAEDKNKPEVKNLYLSSLPVFRPALSFFLSFFLSFTSLKQTKRAC